MDAFSVVRVVDKLSKLIYQEANYLGGFRDAVEWLNTELHRIQCFLKDAERKGRKGDERVKNWVREIRDVAYEIEDLIDIIGAASKRKNRRRSKRSFVGLASRYASAPFDYSSRHHLLCRIDRIKEKIVDISRSREIFGISNFGGTSDPHVDANFPTPLLASPDFEDDVHLVGFEEDKELLVRHLIDQQNQWRSFVSVVGMGGLGKTTLAKKVYHDPRVRRQFDVLCWVTVSRNYRGAEFLNCIIEKVMGRTREELLRMGREEFERKLDQQFQERRCLIVLDDVWLSSTCEDLKRLFPDHKNGSRVLLTTRSLDVARSADPSFAPHMPRFLDDDESWELLQKKAFPSRRGHERRCPGDLEEVGRKLAKNCHGLPLALVVLGSLLFKKGPFPATWNQVFESLDWEFMEDGNKCFDILALSYDDLPDDSFRSCFLYISSFPEGSEIFVSRLIELWNAEGFIRPRPKEAVEKTAKDYIDELSQRCMVQVVKRIAGHGPAKSIRIHDLLREWCISKARMEGFLHVVGGKEKNAAALDATACRRTALPDGLNGSGLYVPSPNLRALLAFNCKNLGNSKQLSFTSLCTLRVLYLEGSSGIMKLPEDIKNMVHLRYLGLKTRLVELPPSIGDLPYLEVLDARLSRIMQLPSRLWRIATLKKVYVGSVEQPVKISKLGSSQSLRVVEWVDIAGGWIERTENEISSACAAPSFRKLGITGIQQAHREALTRFLRKLRHLASLNLCFSDHDGEILIHVLRSLSDHHELRSLKLHGRYFLAIARRAWAFPPNLTKLVLHRFEFLQDPMEALEKLRHLEDLQILAPEVGHRLVAPDYKLMTCSAGGFPRLQHLQLYGLKVEEWRIEASAMRSLTSLTMISMVKLRKVPEGLQHIATLQELAFNDMSRDFYRRIKASEGEDWQFINHVPSVSIREGFMKIWLSDSFPSQQLKAFIFSRKAAKEFIMGGRSSNVPEQLQLELLASEDSPGVLDETDTVIEGR
ncbi:putative disease resistance protein At1g50180 [Curcuma longa]|uniref:putative disease resistance protein At1g50180 n=1 Tax=Curcuma longa TaxID=136217 RepID=UPI003D9F7916